MAARLRRTPGRRAARAAKASAWRRFSGWPGSSAQARWLMARTGARRGRRSAAAASSAAREAEAVHAAVELEADGPAGEVARGLGHLGGAVEAGDEVEVAEERRVAGHQAGEDVDGGAGAERLAQRGAFLGEGDEEGAGAGGGEGGGDAGGAEAVGVGLDHGGGLDQRRGERVERAPVGGDGAEVDGEDGRGRWRASLGRGAHQRAAFAAAGSSARGAFNRVGTVYGRRRFGRGRDGTGGADERGGGGER